ncbi:MAG: SH3 domain-containing protein [Burkholderiaceae bacterium]
MRRKLPFHAAWRAIAVLCAGATFGCVAADRPLQATCGGGVCVANLGEDAAMAPCAGATLLLAWRQSGGATLIQCNTSDAEMDRPSFAYNRDAPAAPAFPLTGMRFFMGDTLEAGSVGDKFAARGFCKPPNPPRMVPGEILIGEKVPSDDEKNPYCYRVLRIGTTPGGVAIKADDNDAPKAEARHADWDKLAAKMTALIRATGNVAPAAASHVPPAAAAVARIVHAKAPLREAPDAGLAEHGWLVQGDEVTLLDRSRAADGWIKVRYVGKSGKAIDRWVRADDLDIAAPAAAIAH